MGLPGKSWSHLKWTADYEGWPFALSRILITASRMAGKRRIPAPSRAFSQDDDQGEGQLRVGWVPLLRYPGEPHRRGTTDPRRQMSLCAASSQFSDSA